VSAGVASRDRSNPYVGPRAFTTRDQAFFFGRERETDALFRALTVERILLLHSPSGAGKTSLIQAGLIPRLEERGFVVLPVVRVHHPDIADTADYTRSVLLHLESGLAPEEQLPDEELARLDLDGYLTRRWPDTERAPRIVLIVDQFEEILALDGNDAEARRSFFNGLGAALCNRRRWSLFSMREEFIAGLHPYLKAIPTHLGARFQLPMMDQRSASEAITRPAGEVGVPFEAAAAQHLITSLRTVELGRRDVPSVGAVETVEPLHLQVACYQLWERWRRLQVDTLSLAHVEELADVDQALRDYYAEKVHAAATEAGIAERLLRAWIEEHLFDRHGIRLQVRHGAESVAEIGTIALASLHRGYLVRAESARGSTWYELAHDRLVQPIRADNRAWRRQHLQPFQRRAEHWHRAERPDGMLLQRGELEVAEAWLPGHADEVTALEREYLERSRSAEARRRRRRRLRRVAAAAVAGVGAALAAIVIVVQVNLEAEYRRDLGADRYEQGVQLASANDVEGAETLFEEALRADPSLLREPRAEVLRFRGLALLEAGDREAGIGSLEEAADLDPQLALPLATVLLADAERRAANGDEAAAERAYARVTQFTLDRVKEGRAQLLAEICRLGDLDGQLAAVKAACDDEAPQRRPPFGADALTPARG
jgi:tetratricopeptide (TPR) repeat protein